VGSNLEISMELGLGNLSFGHTVKGVPLHSEKTASRNFQINFPEVYSRHRKKLVFN